MTQRMRQDDDRLAAAMQVVNEQAEDFGLWFQPVYATEHMLQQALRRLHAVIEGKTPEECVAELTRRERKTKEKGK